MRTLSEDRPHLRIAGRSEDRETALYPGRNARRHRTTLIPVHREDRSEEDHVWLWHFLDRGSIKDRWPPRDSSSHLVCSTSTEIYYVTSMNRSLLLLLQQLSCLMMMMKPVLRWSQSTWRRNVTNEEEHPSDNSASMVQDLRFSCRI